MCQDAEKATHCGRYVWSLRGRLCATNRRVAAQCRVIRLNYMARSGWAVALLLCAGAKLRLLCRTRFAETKGAQRHAVAEACA
eukprot:4200962-Pleurochrysis_carterae.AAC.3